MKKKGITTPHIFSVMFVLIIAVAIFTWILPAGNYSRIADPNTQHEIIVPGSYNITKSNGIGVWQIGISIFEGFIGSSDLIAFIFIASGYISLLTQTGAINAFINYLLESIKKTYIIIPVFFLIFAFAGSTMGIYEELYVLIPVFMMTFEKIGFGKLTGAAVVVFGCKVGTIASTLNPFTVGIANNLAGTESSNNNMIFVRLLCFFILTIFSILYLVVIAKKNKARNTNSFISTYVSRNERKEIKLNQKLSLCLLLLLFGAICIGILRYGFSLAEIAALFFIATILTGIVNGFSSNQISEDFIDSCKMMVCTALIISLSKTLQIIMEKGQIIDTVIYYLSIFLESVPTGIASVAMLVMQILISFFVPSASGHAVLTMPIMAAVSDTIGLSRDVSVLCYQFANGLGTLMWPTECAIICSIMGISLKDWYQFIFRLLLSIALIVFIFIFVCSLCITS